MSKYEWESGSIVIPADQWVAFRRGLIEAHNNEQLRLFEVAKRVLVTVKLAGKGRRNYNWHEAICTAAGDRDADAVSMPDSYISGRFFWATPVTAEPIGEYAEALRQMAAGTKA